MERVHQGDILKIERIKKPVLVVSKDFFNQTHEIIKERGLPSRFISSLPFTTLRL